jgi:hypothetical protein
MYDGKIIYIKIQVFTYSLSFPMAYNVLQLGEVAEIEAQMFNLVLMFIRNPNVQFSTEPAILPNAC